MPLRSEPVELGEIVRAVAAEFELRARERSTSIDVDPARRRRAGGAATPDAVARVVRILLDNALRYGPRGAPGRGSRRTSRGGHAAITVADQGAGIPPEERDRIFERFHRGTAAGVDAAASASGSRSGASWRAGWAASSTSTATARDGTRFALTLHAAHAPAEPPRGERDRVSA